MRYVIFGASILGILVLLWHYTDVFRYAKTLTAIVWVTPYEQAGTGTGSVLVIGDSTGYGTGAAVAQESVPGRLGQDFPKFTIENNSRNGRYIKGAQAIAESIEGQYDLILLQIGANDLIAGRPPQAVADDMQQLVRTLQPHAASVVIMTAGNIGSAPAFSDAQAAQLSTAAKQYTERMLSYTESLPNVAYVSLYDTPENDPFLKDPDRYFAWDDLHPSSEGYRLWYEKAKPALAAALTDAE